MKERYYNPKIFIKIYLTGLASGIISGMIGLGAGLVMVPTLLYLEIHPRVSSATSAFNYVFIALTNLATLVI